MTTPPSEERLALSGAKRNVEAMRAVRDGRYSERSESGPAAHPQHCITSAIHNGSVSITNGMEGNWDRLPCSMDSKRTCSASITSRQPGRGGQSSKNKAESTKSPINARAYLRGQKRGGRMSVSELGETIDDLVCGQLPLVRLVSQAACFL